MFPLLQKDGLAIATFALTGFFITLCHGFAMFEPVRASGMIKNQRQSPKPIEKNQVSHQNHSSLLI
jgi:hypothetical protein